MSTNVDERVVRMEFDDSGFTSGANKAIGILDRLKIALNFDSASSGFSNLQKSANSFTLDSVSDGIGRCSGHFSAFESFVTGVFLRLGSRAADLGSNLVRNLTVRSISDGFEEYQLQIGSIQTILSNAGDSLKEQGFVTQEEQIGVINERLDELNEYADKTIYNFSQMTRNLGLFTAAGVDLDTAASAIQGISNLAAASGANNEAAGRAMYNLSQAIATGTVRLMDWNSVINAGMGGELFQNALKRTARAHGVAVDQIIEKNGSFRDSLQEGWLTADILTDTLSQLTIQIGDVGYETREAGIETLKAQGYTEEEANAILDLANNAYEAATKVRTWKQLWETVGEALGSGWSASWRIIVGDFLEATELFTWFSDRISEMINSSADARNKLLQDWADLGGRSALFGSLQNMFTAIQVIIEAIGDSFDAVFGVSAYQLVHFSEKIAEFTEGLVISDQEAEYLAGTFDIIFSVLKGGGSVVLDITAYFLKLAGGILEAFNKANAFRRIAVIFKTVSEAIFIPLNAIGTAFSEVFSLDSVGGDLSGVVGRIIRIFENLSKSLVMSDESAASLHDSFKRLFEMFKKGFDGSVFSEILNFFSGIVESVKNSGVIEAIKEFFASMDFGRLGSTASLSLFSAAIWKIGSYIKAFLNPEDTLRDSIFEIFDKLKESLDTFVNSVKVGSLLAIAIAIGILSASLVALSTIPEDKIIQTTVLLSSAIAELIGGFVAFSKLSGGGKAKGISAMIFMAIAINILASAMQKISTIGWEDIAKGLSTIAVLLTEFIIAFNNVPDSGRILSSAAAMLIMSVAIGALAVSMKLISTIDWEDIEKGLVTIAVLLTEFIIAFNNVPDSGRILSSAAAMLIMSVAIGALAVSMKLISTIGWEDIAKGLSTIAVLLTGVGIALALFQANIGGAIAMGLVAASVLSLAGAVSLLVPSIQSLSQLNFMDIVSALIALGGALLVVGGVASVLSTAAAPTITFALSMLMLGGAVYLVAQGIAVLAGVFGPAVSDITEAAGDLVVGAINGITGKIQGIIEAARNIGSAFLNAFKNFLGINSPSTVMAEMGVNIVQGMIDGITNVLGSLGEAALSIGSSILDGLKNLPGNLLDLGRNALSNLSSAFSSGKSDIGGKVKGVVDGAAENAKGLGSKLKTTASTAMTTFGTAIKSGISGAKTHFSNLVSAASNAVAPMKNKLKSEASQAMMAFANTIKAGASASKAAVNSLMNATSGAVRSIYRKFYNSGRDSVRGLIEGIDSLLPAAKRKAQELMDTAVKAANARAKIKSPSRVFMQMGGYMVEGLIIGISNLMGDAADASANLSGTVIDSFGSSLNGMAVSMDDLLDTDYNPVITPVINSAEFDSNLQQLSALMNSRLANSIDIGNVNYNETFAGKLDAVADINKQAMQQFAENAIDYDLLGVSVANALIRSGVHVEMDGGQLMGYLAGEIKDVRRMYG